MPAQVCAIVASVGRPEMVGAALRSIIRQSVSVAEILLVTPEPTDAPDLAEFEGRVRHVLSPRGLTSQRNTGIREASTETDYLLFADDDAILHTEYVEMAVQFLGERSEYVGLTGRVLLDGAAARREVPLDEAETALERLVVDRASRPTKTRALYGCNFMVRAAVARVELFDEQLPLYGWLEDLDFARRAERHGTLAHHPGAAAVHRGVGSGGRTSHLRFGYSQIANPVHLRRKRLLSRFELAGFLMKALPNNALHSVGPRRQWRRTRLMGNLCGVSDLIRRRLTPKHAIEIGYSVRRKPARIAASDSASPPRLSRVREVFDGRESVRRVSRGVRLFPVVVGVLLTQLSLIATGIITARSLGVEGRGQLALTLLVPTLSSFLATGGLVPLAAAIVGQYGFASTIIGRGLRLAVMPVSICTIGCGAVTYVLTASASLAVLAAVAVPALAIGPLLYAPAVGLGNYRVIAFGQAGSSILYALGIITVVGISTLTTFVATAMWVVALYLSAAFGIHVTRSKDQIEVPEHELDSMGRRSWRGLLATHSPIESFRIDQVAVASLGHAQLGLYTTALALANLPKLVGQSVALVVPSLAGRPGLNRSRPWVLVAVGNILPAVALVPLCPFLIPLLFGDEFVGAIQLSQVLVLAGGFMGGRKIMAERLRWQGREKLASYSEGLGTLIFVGGAVPSLLLDSLLGVAFGLMSGSAVSLLLMIIASRGGSARLVSGGIKPTLSEAEMM